MGQDASRKVDALQPSLGGRQIFIDQRARYRKNHIGDLGPNQLEENSCATHGDESIPEIGTGQMSENTIKFDLIVIGGGPAGVVGAT